MPTLIDLTGSQEEIAEIIAWAKNRAEVEEVSEPTTLDSSRALNVGLPHIDPTEALNFVTLVFTTGTAAIGFFKALRSLLASRGGAVAVTQSLSGESLGNIEPGTSDEAIDKMSS